MKTLKKVLFYFILMVVVVLIAFTASVFLFKDRIIQEFIREANKSLNTPVKIGKIEIATWSDFPNLAIVFTDVYIEDGLPGESALLTAKTISFYMNPLEVWNGNYAIRGLQITESETNLKVNAVGKNNYTILKESSDSTKAGSIRFDLKNVKLKNTKVTYEDKQANQSHLFSSEQLTASISITDQLYAITCKGDVTTGQIGIGSTIFLKNKSFDVISTLTYDDQLRQVVINSSTIQVKESTFSVTGNYTFLRKNLIDIAATGEDTNIRTLISLLPEHLTKNLIQYQSEGDVFFNLKLKGEISDHHSPFISVSFGCQNATLFHPDYNTKIEHANFDGSFASASMTDLSKGELFLKNITGELNKRTFQANLSLQNFNDPYVNFDFKGELDAASLLNFYPIEQIKDLNGTITADFSFLGKIGLLKNKSTAQQVRTDGSIEIKDLNFKAVKHDLQFNHLNGSLQFNHNDLALSNVGGKFENSDFVLNGFFKNSITFLLFENQPIGIEADLKSNFLDLDQLFEIGLRENGTNDFGFTISPNVHLNFNCEVKAMKYKRFSPRFVKGDLLVKNQMAVSRNINLKAMGGDITLNGIVDAKNPKAIDVVSGIQLTGVHVDSIFYVFENFHQNFIEAKHLQGQAIADISLEMTLNEKLKLFPETLVADISITAKNGELNNFTPLQKLNKYLDDEGLNKLRFADLKNDIHIENKIIYIPQMEIKTNVTTLLLSGTHSFDQQINYRVTAPLRNKKKIDPDEAFGAVEEDGTGKAKVFLKITGTTEDYVVSLDKEAVKKKIASDFKKEVQELKDAFKQKGKKKKKELELSEEEFDWDNN